MSYLQDYEEMKLAEERSWIKGLGAHMKKSFPTALAFGAGTAAGTAAGALANKIYASSHGGEKVPVKYLAIAAPLVGGLLAKLYHDAHASADSEHNS